MLADPDLENYHCYLQGLRHAEPAAAQQSQLTPKQQAYVALHIQRSQEKHADPTYSSIENRAAHTLLYSTELQRLTPRAVKRFLNHHYLATFLLPESELVQPAVLDPVSKIIVKPAGAHHALMGPALAETTSCQLMGWMYFLTAYPEAMRAVLKVSLIASCLPSCLHAPLLHTSSNSSTSDA